MKTYNYKSNCNYRSFISNFSTTRRFNSHVLYATSTSSTAVVSPLRSSSASTLVRTLASSNVSESTYKYDNYNWKPLFVAGTATLGTLGYLWSQKEEDSMIRCESFASEKKQPQQQQQAQKHNHGGHAHKHNHGKKPQSNEAAEQPKCPHPQKKEHPHQNLPVVEAQLTFAPAVPPPTKRLNPALLKVKMDVQIKDLPLDDNHKYEMWTFNGGIPGPFVRGRVGDVMEVELKNGDMSGMPHNLDFHAASGPGGGASLLTVESGESKRAWFKLTQPGLFLYHCAVDPVGQHMANGMYGMVLVEPEFGLPPVDKEFCVLQSEFYTQPSLDGDTSKLEFNYDDAVAEKPTHVVFNGRMGSMTEEDNRLKVNKGDRVRIYFVNAGPNLISSFHIIGVIMDRVYREGDLISPPARGLQTTMVPAGGSVVVEFTALVPGVFTLVDHSILRLEKGAVGFLEVSGDPSPELFTSDQPPKNCPDCKLHP